MHNGEIKDSGSFNDIMSSTTNLNLISNIELERQESLKRSESIRPTLSRPASVIRSNSESNSEKTEFNKLVSSIKFLECSTVQLVMS